MNKPAIKNFAIWARNKLIADVSYQAGLLGITESGIARALPQSSGTTEFYDIGFDEPYEITGEAIRQRRSLAERIRRKEADTDYATAYKYIIEEVSYTWFNRLIAVRFMEVNNYLPARIRVLSSESGKIEPDIVTNPFDTELDLSADEESLIMQLKSANKLDELFQMLFIKQCNALNAYLPALFEKTNDYTELLLNLSVIDQDGVVWHLVNDIPEDDFNVERGGQVEIIGWLYQYYNTEPKDAVFKRPSGQKIKKEEVPAATQLFTPDWIVRYMVENSLGRLWVESHPDEALKKNWKYYLEEAEQELQVQERLDEIRKEHSRLNPEDLTCIDPCMGSGHILVYLFDVLMQIYESQGYSQRDAAQSILKNNLYGLDIDDRAAQMAYFAVMMKARQYDRRILTRGIEPHVYSIPESNGINRAQLKYFGATLSDSEKQQAVKQMTGLLEEMKEAKEYGSALQIKGYDWDLLERFVEGADDEGQYSFESMDLDQTQAQLHELIKVAKMLSEQYQITVTNPPYMGGSGMSAKLSAFVKKNYPDSKSDFFSVFMERAYRFSGMKGFTSLITMESWMFLSSFEKLRRKINSEKTIVNMVHMPYLGKGGTSLGINFGTAAVITYNSRIKNYNAQYEYTVYYECDEDGVPFEFPTINERWKAARQENFTKIPGSPVAYWVSEKFIRLFSGGKIIDYATPRHGMSTGNNDLCLRLWYEISVKKICFDAESTKTFDESGCRYAPYKKGGDYRLWYGNNDYVIAYSYEARMVMESLSGYRASSNSYFFRPSINWSDVSASYFGVRMSPRGFAFDGRGASMFCDDKYRFYLMGILASKISSFTLNVLNPTLTYNINNIENIPVIFENSKMDRIDHLVYQNIILSRTDWDMFETSWDFYRHPMLTCVAAPELTPDPCPLTIAEAAWRKWQSDCETRFQTLKSHEEELNRIFIDIYGLQDELTPDVADKDVTVRRFFDSKDDIPEEMHGSSYALTKQDAVKSLISYVVGCMFGRYSLDEEGLAYAGGEWDNSKYSTFIPDADNCIPISDEEYFKDDIVGLFCAWLKAAYGEKTLEQNLDFIAQALGNKGNTSREVIRNYFLKDFFADHCKTYKKRPIYWLFDSGKQNGFKALVYMHRWTADTIGTVNADYLLRSQRVYESEINRMQDMADHSQNPREAAAASKRKEKLSKQLKECKEYYEKLSHLALERIDIDLDDGVKVNYRKVQTGSDGKFYEVLADSKNIMGKK